MDTAYYSFTVMRPGPFAREMWHVFIDGQWTAVMIEYAKTWFAAVGSINDLKAVALSVACEAMGRKR